MRSTTRVFAVGLLGVCLASCQSLQYKAWEQLGVEKRDLLLDNVEDARDAQTDAKSDFASALDAFRSAVDFDGGDLGTAYEEMNRAYERSASSAEKVSSRIADIETVAEDLFDEWEDEIGQYQDARLKQRSQTLLSDTQDRYADLINAMRQAEQTAEPVLNTFRDRVLFLKHNLNARAISSLRGDLQKIETDTSKLIAEMNAAIDSANSFIENLNAEKT